MFWHEENISRIFRKARRWNSVPPRTRKQQKAPRPQARLPDRRRGGGGAEPLRWRSGVQRGIRVVPRRAQFLHLHKMTHALTSAMTTEAGYDWTAISPKVAILGRHFLLATSVATETVLDRPRSWLASKQTIKQGSTQPTKQSTDTATNQPTEQPTTQPSNQVSTRAINQTS